MAVTLKTGSLEYIDIEFDRGDKFQLGFNPADPDLLIKFKNFSENLKKYQSKLDEKKELDFAGVYEEVVSEIKLDVDSIFRSPVSEMIFKYTSPLAIVDDELFVTLFFSAILPEIKDKIKQSNERMKKHTEKYAKG